MVSLVTILKGRQAVKVMSLIIKDLRWCGKRHESYERASPCLCFHRNCWRAQTIPMCTAIADEHRQFPKGSCIQESEFGTDRYGSRNFALLCFLRNARRTLMIGSLLFEIRSLFMCVRTVQKSVHTIDCQKKNCESLNLRSINLFMLLYCSRVEIMTMNLIEVHSSWE